MENKSNTVQYNYYVVAFIDVLGQSDAFRYEGIYLDSYKSPFIGNRDEINKRLLEAHKKTAKVVEDLRSRFKEYIKLSVRDPAKPIPPYIPQDQTNQYKQMIETDIDLRMFSDCILATTCVSDVPAKKIYGSILTSVFYILIACEGMMLDALAIGKPFRGAIDIGMGTRLGNGDIYGPVSSRVYELERNIVQYPRIVLGEELINFLINIHKHSREYCSDDRDAEYCKQTAQTCLNRIKKDLDGVYILDYLGKEAAEEMKRAGQGDILEEYYQKSFKFIDEEYQKHKENMDQKLAQRYFMLKQYFIDSRK
jgi:hypothetical protein